MPSRRLSRPPVARLIVASLLACSALVVATPAFAQDLIAKMNARLDEQPDALAMLKESAQQFEASGHTAFTLVNATHVEAGERDTTEQLVMEIKIGASENYMVQLVKPTTEFFVRSDGERTMTYVEPLEQYSISDEAGGFKSFTESKLAGMIGNGFGPLVFSLFDPEATQTLVDTTTSASYLGEEEVDGATVHHCRYTTGGMDWDAWFTTGNDTRLTRVQPDLSPVAAKSDAAKKYDNFLFEMTFEVKDYDDTSKIATSAFALTPPEGAIEVDNALSPPPPPPHALLGKKAPVFETVNPAGEPVDLGELIGEKVIILDFWATWCGPCVAAMPRIEKVAGEFADQGVVLFAVNQGEDAQTVKQFLKAQELNVPVVLDQEGAAAMKYQVEGLPTSVIIGKDGRVQVVHIGFSESLEDMLRGELQQLVAGRDLAGEELATWQKSQAKRAAAE